MNKIKVEKGGIINQLKSILSLESHADATYESAARITCLLLGELPKEIFYNEQKAFLL